MPFSLVSDDFYDHPKVDDLDPELSAFCASLWVRALSYCGKHLTDGRVARGKLAALCPLPTSAVGVSPRDIAEELVRVGLWERCESGYAFHEWEQGIPSRERVLEKRRSERERKSAYRKRTAPTAAVVPVSVPAGVPLGQDQGHPQGQERVSASPFPSLPFPSLPGSTTTTSRALAREGPGASAGGLAVAILEALGASRGHLPATEAYADALAGYAAQVGCPQAEAVRAVGEVAADATAAAARGAPYEPDELDKKARTFIGGAAKRWRASPRPVVAPGEADAALATFARLYAASGRRYGPYAPDEGDRDRAGAIFAHARELAGGDGAQELFEHWIGAYLRDTGSRDFSLVEKRHALRWLKSTAGYGMPKPKRAPGPASASSPRPPPTYEPPPADLLDRIGRVPS